VEQKSEVDASKVFPSFCLSKVIISGIRIIWSHNDPFSTISTNILVSKWSSYFFLSYFSCQNGIFPWKYLSLNILNLVRNKSFMFHGTTLYRLWSWQIWCFYCKAVKKSYFGESINQVLVNISWFWKACLEKKKN